MSGARGPDRLGLVRQLLPGALGAVFVLLAAVLAFGLYNDALYHQAREHEVTSQAEVLAASVSAALAFDDRAAVREYVDAVAVNPAVLDIVVLNAEGAEVAHLHRPGAAGAGIFSVDRPVRQGGAALGRVRVTARVESVPVRRLRVAVVVALAGVAALLLVAFALWERSVRRTNRQLADAYRRLEEEVAERSKAEEALAQSQKMEALGQLTGGIAHDFNNVLQAVAGAFDLIQNRPDDLERVRRWSRQGLGAAERGASLAQQLLAFSRAQKLEQRPLMVGERLEALRDILVRTTGPDVEVRIDTTGDLGPVLSDPTQFDLAILNLALNARDAMPGGGVLSIGCGTPAERPEALALEPGDYVEVRVSDTGVGMAPEVQARAFDPFFTTKGVGKGTGLGLSQVYGLALQAGGGARIESREGAGTLIRVFLRRAPPQTAADPDPPRRRSAAEAAATRPLSILVVDDDASVRDLVCDGLSLVGHTVSAADGGEAALAMLEAAAPDLLLVDFAMPGMNGAELAARARARRPGLYILFASGYADSAQVEAAVGAGAAILRKPFDIAELAAAVGKACPDGPAA